MDLKAGDTVRLKSGGPLMTIEDVDTYDAGVKATCVWFENATLQTALFALETIVQDTD